MTLPSDDDGKVEPIADELDQWKTVRPAAPASTPEEDLSTHVGSSTPVSPGITRAERINAPRLAARSVTMS